jgi:hypothetical protein
MKLHQSIQITNNAVDVLSLFVAIVVLVIVVVICIRFQ